MSKKVVLLDDMEDSEVVADETIEYSIDGDYYEIDVARKNGIKLRVALEPWIKNSRKVPGHHKPAKTAARGVNMARSSGYNSEQLAAIREWGRRNGWPEISSKGKVAREIISAFEERAGAEVVVPEPQFSAT